MGLKPLYYYFDEKRFIFGSEIKSILSCDVERRINLKTFNIFLSLGYIPFDSTLFKNIFKIPPSNYLKFDLNKKQIKLKKYWNIDFSIVNDKSIDQLTLELRKLIEESIKIRLISDVPLGAFLSGGIDSSAVVGIMSRLMDQPVKTFSISFENNGLLDETKYFRFVSDYYNTDHTEIIVDSSIIKILPELIWHLDDLITDATIIPVYLMAKYAKSKMTVALTGDSADEIFAGYYYYNPEESKIDKFLPKKILKRKKRGFGTPANIWLKTRLKEVSGEILERLEKRNYLLKPTYVKIIKKNRFSSNFRNIPLNLIMFELWYEIFIENNGLKPINF